MKQAILKVAADLFAKYGYDAVSMNDIAKKLKITKPALYYYFEGKRDIYLASLTQVIEEHGEKLTKAIQQGGTVEEKLRRFIIAQIGVNSRKTSTKLLPLIREISRKDKKILNFLTKKKEELLGIIEPLVKEIISNSKHVNKDANVKMLSVMLMGAINVFITEKMLYGETEWTSEVVADQILGLFF